MLTYWLATVSPRLPIRPVESLVQKPQHSSKTYEGHYLSFQSGDMLSYSYMVQQATEAVQRGNVATVLGTVRHITRMNLPAIWLL